ncbi:sodium channel protein Nach-like [Toxorhynchites rutilus septentrionalis]|uniref:sodium channel protein Nach-like n=1 Tax=Toxorhynchites rutilus septentrionalis TaxID=329112 RepID=UPI00247A5794|nr:sodium channel protein Nach-like [Toxorhynchites rutilus septentrionalis]
MTYEFYISNFLRRVVQNSTLHAVFHLTNVKSAASEKFFWRLMIWSSVLSALFLVALFWIRYLTNPTVITLDRNYHEWNTTFPSLTICFHDRMNATARDELIDRLKPNDTKKLERFLDLLVSTDIFSVGELAEYDEYSEMDFKLILNQLTNVINRKVILGNDIEAKFYRVITEMGICYSFNSDIIHLISSEGLGIYNPANELVEINIVERETTASLRNLTSNGDIFYHGPFDAPLILKRFKVHTSASAFLTMTFKPVTVTADFTIQDLYVQQRNCRFRHESNLDFFPSYYSNNLCILECRLKFFIQFCGCIPHFYNLAVRVPICRLKQLKCLMDNHNNITRSLSSCVCLKDCHSISFTLQNYVLFDWFNDPLIKWDMDVPKVRYSRRIIYGFVDAVASTGGIAGLFFGASVITVIELIFLFIKTSLKSLESYRKKQKHPSEQNIHLKIKINCHKK